MADKPLDLRREHELPDDYPIYPGYLYVKDGKVVRATQEMKAINFKGSAKSLTNCDITERKLWHEAL